MKNGIGTWQTGKQSVCLPFIAFRKVGKEPYWQHRRHFEAIGSNRKQDRGFFHKGS
jgi:hypothetical protein